MLEYKKLLSGIFITLLSFNLYSGGAEAATTAEKEEARMWGGFRDKVSCTVTGAAASEGITSEKVVVKEVVVPVYPFLFIWDDWYHWGRWHHHIYRPVPRPPRHHIGRPAPRPPRPAIGKPAPRPPRQEQIGRPGARPNRPAIGKPSGRPGGKRPVMRPASPPRPRPQVKSAPRSRDEQMIFQNGGGPRGGGPRHHGSGRPGGRGPGRR